MHLDIIETKRRETILFSKQGLTLCQKFSDSILQKDKSALIEEKIASIAMATIFTWILGGLFAFTGAGLVLFVIGLILSRLINRKIYGKERDPDKVRDEEKTILRLLNEQQNKLESIKTRATIKSKCKTVVFLRYSETLADIDSFINTMSSHDVSNLSLKYRTLYNSTLKDSQQMKTSFTKAYCI